VAVYSLVRPLVVALTLATTAAGCATMATTLGGLEAKPALAPRVWVNTASGVYHCLGSADYGNTQAGTYMSEADAQSQGHRPAREKICGPPQVWVNSKSGVYHCPGSANYGTTADGAYMTEAAAKEAGARPAGGRPCSP